MPGLTPTASMTLAGCSIASREGLPDWAAPEDMAAAYNKQLRRKAGKEILLLMVRFPLTDHQAISMPAFPS